MSRMKEMLKKKSDGKKETKKSKSTVPVLDTPEEVQEAVDSLLEGKREKTNAEAKIKSAESTILPFVAEARDTAGFDGQYSKSFKVFGTGDSMVTVSQSNWASINPDDQEDIENIVGKGFEFLFDDSFKVELKDGVIGNEKEEAAFMKAMKTPAVEQFLSRFFSITDLLVVKPDFDKNVYCHVNEDGLEELRTFVKMKKPGIR